MTIFNRLLQQNIKTSNQGVPIQLKTLTDEIYSARNPLSKKIPTQNIKPTETILSEKNENK